MKMNYTPINSPCKDCKDRYLGCHSKCKKYNNFKKELAKYHVKEQEERKLYEDLKACEKERKKRRR